MTSLGLTGESAALPDAPTYLLYDHQKVMAATILGSPVAGAILMAMNYRRLKQPGAALGVILMSLAVTGLVLYLSFNSESAALRLFPLILMFGMRMYAKASQGTDIEEHVRRGGQLGSMKVAAFIGLGVMAALLAVVWAMM